MSANREDGEPVGSAEKEPGETSSMREPPNVDSAEKEPGETSSMDEPPAVSDVRIVLVGKTGVGKSSSGNTILGKDALKVAFSDQSVTKDCLKVRTAFDGRNVSVVDTPGLFDTDLTETEVINRLVDCIALSCPGPHVFLLVLKLGRFTKEENQTVKRLQEIFGDEASKHTIILFTWGDQLKSQSIEEYLEGAGSKLREVVEKCGGRYHVFNNENMEDRTQVTGLMEKIFKMVSENYSGCYTNEMYESVETAIQEREEELRNEMYESVERAILVREDELRNQIYENEKHRRNEMEEQVKAKDQEIVQLRRELRERAERDVKKRKFPQLKRVTEQCKQQ